MLTLKHSLQSTLCCLTRHSLHILFLDVGIGRQSIHHRVLTFTLRGLLDNLDSIRVLCNLSKVDTTEADKYVRFIDVEIT